MGLFSCFSRRPETESLRDGSYGSTGSGSAARSESEQASLAVTSNTNVDTLQQPPSTPSGFVPRSVAELHPEYAHAEPYHFTAKTDSARMVLEQASGARAVLRGPSVAPTTSQNESNEKVELIEERWNPEISHTRGATTLQPRRAAITADDFSDIAANISESEDLTSQTTGRNSKGSFISATRSKKKNSKKTIQRNNGKKQVHKSDNNTHKSSPIKNNDGQFRRIVSDENSAAEMNVYMTSESPSVSQKEDSEDDTALVGEGRSSVQRRSKVGGFSSNILKPKALKPKLNGFPSPPRMPVISETIDIPPPDESLGSFSSAEEHDNNDDESIQRSSTNSLEQERYLSHDLDVGVSPKKPPLPTTPKRSTPTSFVPSALSSRKSAKGSYPSRKTVSFREEKPTIIEPNLLSPAEKAAAMDDNYNRDRDVRDDGPSPSPAISSIRRQPRTSMTFDERMSVPECDGLPEPQVDKPHGSMSAEDLRALKKRQSLAVRDAISQQIRGIPRSAMLAYAENEALEKQLEIDRESKVEPLTDDWFRDMSPSSARVREMSEAVPVRGESPASRPRARSTKSMRLPPQIHPGQTPPPPPPPPFEPARTNVRSVRTIPSPPPARESYAKLKAVGALDAPGFDLPPSAAARVS